MGKEKKGYKNWEGNNRRREGGGGKASMEKERERVTQITSP
jgi:hypothetical protein